MRKLVVLISCIVLAASAGAQVNIGGDIEKGYRDFVQQTRTVISAKDLTDFEQLGGQKRFVSENWMKGAVLSVYGPITKNNYRFNYDFLDKQLYALFSDSVIAVENAYVVNFYLQDGERSRFFTRVPAIDKDNFIESLAYDSSKKSSYQILKHRIVTLVKNDRNSYMSNFNGSYADQVKTKIEYYLSFPDDTFTKIKLDKKSLNAALKGKHAKAEAFLQESNSVNEANVLLLLQVLNG